MTSPSDLWLGVDLGGTKTEVAVLGSDAGFRYRERTATPSHDYAALVAHLVEQVQRARAACDLPPDHPVGVGIPGCIDAHTQQVRGANTQCLNGQPLQKDLSLRLGAPVFVQNDANCLALSESVDGAAAGTGLSFAVILGTGCGGGLALRGEVWTGPNALAGEWGHNPLPWPRPEELQAPACWCGLQGCMETWISGPGLARDHARVTGQTLDARAIVAAMSAGDAAARASVLRYTDRLARGLAQVVNLLDPEVIVLGGGLSQVQALYPLLPEAISRYTFHRPVHTPVRPAVHGDSSGIRGAAWLCRPAAASGTRA